MTRQVQAVGASNTATSPTLHFGLGDQPTIDRVEITWPGGHLQSLKAVAANRLHQITEDGYASSTSPGGKK